MRHSEWSDMPLKNYATVKKNAKYLPVINTAPEVSTGDTCLQTAPCDVEISRCVVEQTVPCASRRPKCRAFLETFQKFKSRADFCPSTSL